MNNWPQFLLGMELVAIGSGVAVGLAVAVDVFNFPPSVRKEDTVNWEEVKVEVMNKEIMKKLGKIWDC